MPTVIGITVVLGILLLYSGLRILRGWNLNRQQNIMPKMTDDETKYMEGRSYGDVSSIQNETPKTNGRRRRRWEEHFGSRRNL